MADDSPKPARGGGPRASRASDDRRSSRLKVAGKLTALLGLPLLVIFAIFASGVYVGAVRADRVVSFEQRWLRIDPPAGRVVEGSGDWSDDSSDEGSDDGEQPGETGDEAPEQPEPEQPEPEAPEQPEPEPEQPEAPTKPEPEQPEAPTKPEPESVGALAIASADPVGPELRARFDERSVVRLKVMVDPALVVAREDWLGYVAELVDATGASYERLFGIEVRLQAVAVWDAAVGADADALLEDLAAHERDGADVILGLVARAQPSDYAAPPWTAERTGDHALVFADLQQGDRYYRNLLRALAILFGAEPTTDAAAKQLGSFMTDVEPPAAAAPVIDPENRGKVIINKRRDFARPPAGEREEEGTI